MQTPDNPTARMPSESPVTSSSAPVDRQGEALELLQTQIKQVQAENRRLRNRLAEQAGGALSAENVRPKTVLDFEPQEAQEALMSDPVAFVSAIVKLLADKHLGDLKEEAELRGALNTMRKKHPEFARFERFIMQEVALLIQNDEDGHIAPWDELLEKALAVFRDKFKEQLEAEKDRLQGEATKADNQNPPHQEGAAPRQKDGPMPSFTRDQIANMSMGDFLANEAAINLALKNKRIK